MAGLGTKLWASGEVVTAAGVNGYLQDQVIGTYASTSARDAAFGGAGEPTLSEGMFAYTTDTNTLWSYNGSSWVAVLGSDIGAISTSNRNSIINGAMNVNQRSTATAAGYTLDRWHITTFGTSFNSLSVTQQTGTPPSGFRNYMRVAAGSATATNIFLSQSLETANVIPFAGKTVTASFYYRVNTNFTSQWTLSAVWSTGTDANLSVPSGTLIGSSQTITNTTSWTRFTYTFAVPSTATSFALQFSNAANTVATGSFDITGVQLEQGSVATPFEFEQYSTTLAKCQRYYWRANAANGAGVYYMFGFGQGDTTTNVETNVILPVVMRTAPTAIETTATASNYGVYSGTVISACTSLPLIGTSNSTPQLMGISFRSTGAITVGRAYQVIANNNNTAYLGFSAEL